jgi:two-component system, sensor histidine kinase
MLDVLKSLLWQGTECRSPSFGTEAPAFQLDEAFETFQLRALALQAQRVLVPVLAVSAVIAWLLPKSDFELSGWLLWLLVAALMVGRWRYSQHYLGLWKVKATTVEMEVPRCSQTMLLINGAIGLSTGAFCWLGFPGAGPMQHAAITTLLVGLAAGAVATCSSSRWSFVAYAAPLFLQLTVAWIVFGQVPSPNAIEGLDPQAPMGLHLVFAATIVALFWVLLASCNDSESWIRSAFNANLANQNFVSQLKSMNVELSEQRESALAANQAKTRFLAAASHDLRQPLHALSLYSASLSLQTLPARATQLAEAIQDCISKSLAPLLDALLDVSKLDAKLIVPVLESFEFGTTLSTVRQEFQTRCDAKGLALYWDVPEACSVLSDPRLLVQIVRNLLDNALKYTEIGSVSLHVTPKDRMAWLDVSDTGVGIDAVELPRIFEEFYQCGNVERDRSKGLGLGLAIVKRLCDLMRLELAVESRRHVGTRFRLELPLTDQSLDHAALPLPSTAEITHLGMQVLVVDNELMVRDSTRCLLEEWGCEVSVATNAQEALQLAMERPFDILLSDYRLKASENGLQVLSALSKIQPQARCWLVTGETGPLPWPQLQAQKIKVLHKPLQPRIFLQALMAP